MQLAASKPVLALAELTRLSFLRSDDFPTFLDAQARVDAAYQDQTLWTRKSILSTAGSGKFSSDRTIMEYAKDIWDVEGCPRPTGK